MWLTCIRIELQRRMQFHNPPGRPWQYSWPAGCWALGIAWCSQCRWIFSSKRQRDQTWFVLQATTGNLISINCGSYSGELILIRCWLCFSYWVWHHTSVDPCHNWLRPCAWLQGLHRESIEIKINHGVQNYRVEGLERTYATNIVESSAPSGFLTIRVRATKRDTRITDMNTMPMLLTTCIGTASVTGST